MQRSCGDCSECCTLLGVQSIGKAAFVECPLLKKCPGGMCSIYEERPPDCKSYKCLWLQGMGKESDRPDRLGVVWSGNEIPEYGGNTITVFESSTGKMGSARNMELIKRNSEHFPIMWARKNRVPILIGSPTDRKEYLTEKRKSGEITFDLPHEMENQVGYQTSGI